MTDAADRYRLFCAALFEAPALDAAERALSAPRASLSGFRWSTRGHWHLTLAFYGDVAAADVPALGDALGQAVPGPALPVSLHGLGAFPNLRGPRVLWVGLLDPTKGLAELQRRIETAGSSLGFGREDRRYHPHLTVARAAQGRPRPVVRELGPLADLPIADTVIRDVVLFRSILAPGGSVYTALRTFTLGDPA